MHRSTLVASLLLIACDPETGTPDGGPAAFEVALESAPGDALEDGDSLGVYYGCQGGAHVVFDVTAIGEGLEGATVDAELQGTHVELEMMPTSNGAQYRGVFLMFSTSAFAGQFNGVTERVAVTVESADGARASIERRVTLTEMSRCGGSCEYDDLPGAARITSVEGPSGTGCTPEALTVTFDFVPEDASATDTGIVLGPVVAPDCVDELGLVAGQEVSAVRRDIVPGTGTCTPRTYDLLLDLAACEPICPSR